MIVLLIWGVRNKMIIDLIKRKKNMFILYIFAILCVPVFYGVMENGLDPSWLYLLNKLTKLEHMRFGRDMVFTYGILGFLAGPMDFDTNLLQGVFFYGVLYMGQLYAFYRLMLKRNISNERAIIVLVLFFLGQPAYTSDLFIESSVVIALLLLWKEPKNWFGLAYLTFATLVAFFYKFSLAIPVIASFLLFTIAKIFCKEIKHLWRLIIPIILIPVCYLIYNPSISDFIKYIVGSWEAAEGFNTAMSVGDYDRFIYWMFILMGIYVMAMLIQLLTQDTNNFWVMLLIIPELFMGYKHGFVRADSGHVRRAYVEIICMLALLSMVYEVKLDIDDKKNIYSVKRGLFIFLFTFALLNYYQHINPWETLKTKIQEISSAIYYNTAYQKERELNNVDSYSGDLLAQIGENTFTTYPWEITAIEHMGENAEGYMCLPCFQMYTCYTPYLDELTAEMFLKESRPRYILMNFDTIDGRLPLIEAPYTWKAIANNYEYVDAAGNIILLEKLEMGSEMPSYSDISEKSISKDHDIIVEDCSEIAINMELSLWGKLVKTLWKIPEVKAKIVYSNGDVAKGRVIVENLTDGIPIQYMPTEQQYKQFISEGTEIPSIVSISFSGEGLQYYKDDINYTEYR